MIAACIVTLLAVILIYRIFVPVRIGAPRPTVILEVNKGMTLKQIARALRMKGLTRDEITFEAAAKLWGAERKIRAGDYELSPSMNVPAILAKLRKGDSLRTCFTIPEGYNLNQIAELLERKGFATKDDFLSLANDRGFAARLGVDADSLEGFLFPDTYCAGKGEPEEELIRMMFAQFGKRVGGEYESRAAELGFSTLKMLTLASIIEKEASDRRERRLVSAVFHNRLKLGMPLQSCATVIYALGDRYEGSLRREDLSFGSPYNTYLRTGLPPGPIVSPGLDAINAALNPAEVDYLYFVSTGNGRHKFSSTLDEHNLAVMEYQIQP